MPGLELHLSLLKILITLFDFILTWDNCLVYCKSLSKGTPKYLTKWVGISCFPWSFNLNKESIFQLFGQYSLVLFSVRLGKICWL